MLAESSNADLDEVIKFRSLCSVTIVDIYLSTGIFTTDIAADIPVYCIDLGKLHDDGTIVAGRKRKTLLFQQSRYY